jgi:hypothetical protein
MQITVHAGGKLWLVDENALINWLVVNAVQPSRPQTVVKEVIQTDDNPKILLNESQRSF